MTEQVKVDKWNASYPVGQKVKLTMDNGEVRETTTRSPAEVLSGHTAVCWFVGVTGCYLLDRAEIVKEATE